MANVITKQESERGCGYRKAGGTYLVSDGPGRACGRMPLPLHVCPTCSQGIKPARGWTWIDGKAILAAAPECGFTLIKLAENPAMGLREIKGPGPECETCPMNGHNENKVGLMWVGSRFYPTPEDFVKEARKMGLSKRIAQIPKELVVGKTWVWLAHRQTIPTVHTPECATERMIADYLFRVKMEAEGMVGVLCDCGAQPTPGVFHAFVPTRIEYVVKGDEPEEELDALEKRGLTLVKIERIGENGELFPDPPPTKDEDQDGN